MKNKICLLVFVFGLMVFHSCTTRLSGSKSSYTWVEEFNGKRLDSSRWSKIPRGGSDWNRNMSDFDSLYAVRGGKLILRGIVNHTVKNDTARYLTGGVYTKNKVAFGNGRLEIRAKLQGAKGAWPAFWLLPVQAQWPYGGEIDIMERLSFDTFAYQTVHSNYTVNLRLKTPPNSGTGPIDPDGFNVYAVEKHTDSLVFFINGKRTFSYPKIETDKPGQFPFNDSEYYLLLDMQLGGSWVGAVDPKDLPVEMEIDWVRFKKF